ncbi:MAG: hypothetical protein JNL79_19505 [Myxococcales bacterium]|nr:hypothetical protein [Myxococcales bacterium]
MDIAPSLTSYGLLGGRDVELSEGLLELLGIEPLTRRAPVLGCELDHADCRPVRQDTQDVAQVGLRIEVVQLRRGDERGDRAGMLAEVVRAEAPPATSTGSTGRPLLARMARPVWCR